jgi:hypothetical protein
MDIARWDCFEFLSQRFALGILCRSSGRDEPNASTLAGADNDNNVQRLRGLGCSEVLGADCLELFHIAGEVRHGIDASPHYFVR